jgi:ribosomal protein L17
MVEPIRASKIAQKELQAEGAMQELRQALLQGNILEVRARLPAHVSVADFERFMSDQWKTWKSQVVQDYQIYEGEGAVAEPVQRYNDFPMHSGGSALHPGEGEEFIKGMTASLNKSAYKAVKAQEAAAADTEESAEKPASLDELGTMGEDTLNEWQNFTDSMWDSIIDAQMMQDYEKRMGEIKQEVEKIISMAKSGQINPEFVLIALAKVNVTKNGVLMTWLGKKAALKNESMNRIADDLQKVPTSDFTAYSAAATEAQAKTRDGAFQLQLLTTDIQKVMQDVASVLEQVSGYIGEINRTRREIIQKFTAT